LACLPTSESRNSFSADQTAERAKDQHDRSAAIARDLDPAKWADASQELAVQVIREWAAAEEARHDAFYEELLRLTTSGQR